MAKLIEVDFSGIEAVKVGYFSGDPNYIRLAKLGVHGYVQSHVLYNDKKIPEPADLKWSDEDLKKFLKELKEKFDAEYNKSKRVVHGCLPPDHEVLTPDGWKRIDTLKEGESVAEWAADGAIRFALPSRITKLELESEALVELDGRGLKIQMTPWHRVPVQRNNKVKEYLADQLPKNGRIPVSGMLVDGHITWGPQAALAVAVQADGSLRPANKAVFHMTRPRKIARLRWLVAQNNTPSKFTPCGCHADGVRAEVQLPPWSDEYGGRYGALKRGTKDFDVTVLLRYDNAARLSFLEELLHWDGTGRDKVRKEYLTTNKHNAHAAQTVAHLSGRQGLIRVKQRHSSSWGKKPLYVVSFNRRKWARLECLEKTTHAKEARTVYCVTVPTTFFLTRWRDTISVTGNTNYGMTEFGMSDYYPEIFPTRTSARKVQDIYFAVCPKLKPWHSRVCKAAHEKQFLGGPSPNKGGSPTAQYHEMILGQYHPYGYKCEFYGVISYRKGPKGEWIEGRGEEAKKTISYFPQSSSAGRLAEAELALFDPESPDFIGDVFWGRTPLRAPIHDSLLLEVPDAKIDFVLERVYRVMTRPSEYFPLPAEWGMGDYLTIGVAVEMGKNWAPKTEKNPEGMAKVGVESLASDVFRDEEDEEEVSA